jgi:hypothetical protein
LVVDILTHYERILAKRPWNYLGFYSHEYLAYLIADFDEWLKTLKNVLQQSNAAA